jgi:hypothetical protein
MFRPVCDESTHRQHMMAGWRHDSIVIILLHVQSTLQQTAYSLRGLNPRSMLKFVLGPHVVVSATLAYQIVFYATKRAVSENRHLNVASGDISSFLILRIR